MKTNYQMRVLLIAEEAAGVQALRLISDSNHILAGVLTTLDPGEVENQNEPACRGKKPLNASIATIARRLNIPVLDAERARDPGFADWMKAHRIDVLLNIHSLHRICMEVIEAASFGAFNLHPGPLPRYAGLNVTSWAVYNEEPEHAVSIHHTSDQIDTGDIVYETWFPLSSADTGLSVSISCARKGMALIERLLNDLSINPDSVPSRPQDLSLRRLYTSGHIPGKGFIQWSAPAHRIDAFVRACNYAPFPSPWGEPKTIWKKKQLSILKTSLCNKKCHAFPGTVGPVIDGKTAVATADHWILLDKCRLDREIIAAATFLQEGELLA